jgi:[glutamine synthetase] adenylyltransferase / [glutamine synthetase]-adenylyl-L-tyrosine phosphorylase
VVRDLLAETPVRRAIDRAADPAIAANALRRVAEAAPVVAAEFATNETLLEAVVAVVMASRSLLASIAHDPSALDDLRDRDALGAARTLDDYSARSRDVTSADKPAVALRLWKQREVVRIAARDLLGIADLSTIARELAALAQACLGTALAIAHPQVPFAIIGMGKLGGRELNYASDVDVMFVHDGEVKEAERVGRAVLHTMSEPTADGIVFRTDADLRPEGRSGAISRSIDAYESYWARWARTWEFQALIKARPVAGDTALGKEFMTRAEPHVWPDVLDPDAVRDVRAMKARTEELLRRKGLDTREVKRGWGGIRDVEFAVQLLQLVHGRHDPSIRSATTLDALEQLARGGYIAVADAQQLGDAYVWLRTVEHRIQLLDERQAHTLPADTTERTLLARVLGFRDRPGASALDAFDAEQHAQQSAVRALHEKLFFAPLLDTLAGSGPLSLDAAEERLTAFGFRDVEQTRAALHELTAGLTRRSRVMKQLLAVILGWLSESPDPDLGLLQLRRLTEGYTRSATLARRFRDTPIAARRACTVLGSSRVLGLALHRNPEFVDTLADDGALAEEPTRDALVDAALETLNWREDESARRAGLRRYKRRQLLRVGTRDLLGFADLEATGRELANLADACAEAALRSIEPELPFAVIGMGRLGGVELSYASDIDVIFVYDGSRPADFDTAQHIATRLVAAIGETTAEGKTFRIDTALRPEGKAGPLARSLAAYRTYYERWALTWEFQSLTRARYVAGDVDLAARFLELVTPYVYRDEFPETAVREVRRMKARIERERIPHGEDPNFHLKLGRGSLSDIEFTVQLLQLVHGGSMPEVRHPSTLRALASLERLGVIDPIDVDHLAAAYELCERARNYRYLLTGTPGDALPVDSDEAAKLGRMLGYTLRPQQALREEYRRVTRRARAVVEHVFYGRT